MKQSLVAIRSFIRDEEAATAAEYGIIAALIGGALLIAMNVFGTAIKGLFSQISAKLNLT